MPASRNILLPLSKIVLVTSSPTPLLNARTILNGDISSVAPTPAPSNDARPLSPSVAPFARARSLASPAPAPTAKAAAAGKPTPGIAAAPSIPAYDPKASPNLRPTKSSDPLSASNKDFAAPPTD